MGMNMNTDVAEAIAEEERRKEREREKKNEANREIERCLDEKRMAAALQTAREEAIRTENENKAADEKRKSVYDNVQ